ncbi:MAG TPA: hypothetical protein VGJ94_18375 [Syntrophorhabdaceae bacterium]|jgi:hypothetical protein
MRILTALVWGVFIGVAIVAHSFAGVVSLPWSSSLDCAPWTYDGSYNVTPPAGCSEFQLESSGSACGTYSQIVAAANRSGSAGNGIRQLVGPGDNVGTTGFDINFGSEPSVWIRWYQRYQTGFTWSTLDHHKDLYLVDYTNGKTNQGIIPEPYYDTYRVFYASGSTTNAVLSSDPAHSGWSYIGDGNWHLYELHVTKAGLIQMWIDERQIINANTGTTFPYNWGLVLFGSNSATPSSTCKAVDYDDLAISNTGYIGPAGGGGGSTPPAVPTGLTVRP